MTKPSHQYIFSTNILSGLLILGLCTAPAFSQSDSRLKATVSKGDPLQTATELLEPGTQFDEKKISAIFSSDIYQDNWYEIPSWLIHFWSRGTENFGSGRLAQKEQNALSGKHANFIKINHGWARYKDAKGQWWKWDNAGLWFVTDEGDHQTYIYGVEDKTKLSSETQWTRSTRTVEVTVDKASGKVTSASQHLRTIKDTIEDTSPYTIKSIVTETVFDEKGQSTDKEEWSMTCNDAGESKPPLNGRLQDGRRLHDLFVQFLKDHGMSDRIPQEEPQL